jgi:hypothetical protein
MTGSRAFLRSLFVRKTADNKQKPGFAVYFFASTVLFICAYAAVHHQMGGSKPKGSIFDQRSNQGLAKVQVDRAATAAATYHAPAPLVSEETNPLAAASHFAEQSNASSSDSVTSPNSMLDTVQAASAQGHSHSEAPRQMAQDSEALPAGFIDEGNRGVKATRPEHTNGAVAQSASVVSGEGAGQPDTGTPIQLGQPLQVQASTTPAESYVVYSGDPAEPEQKPETRPNGFKTGDFLPLGTEFAVIFNDKVQTLDLEGLVSLTVVGDVRSPNGRIQIPNGTHIFGTASRKNIRGRVGVSLQTIVFISDGHEVPISGILKDADGQPGVLGDYYPEPAGADAIGYLAPVATGFLNSLQQTTNSIALGGAGTVQSAVQANPFSFRNQMLTASETALADQAAKKQQELTQLYQAYTEVRQATLATVQLTHGLDLTAKDSDLSPPQSPSPRSPAAASATTGVPPAVQSLIAAGQTASNVAP